MKGARGARVAQAAWEVRKVVAQASSLLYRRLPVGKVWDNPGLSG